MLELLKVQNVALIEEAEIRFAKGLNILSGETGAGKSILIDSINFVLGQRANIDIIRTGAEAAQVEAFLVCSENAAHLIRDMGIDIDDDLGLLLLRNINTSGKSVCRANGKMITTGMMREISALLIDIHGQHEHQSLLSPKRHLHLLDRFCQDELAHKRARLSELLKQHRAVLRNLKSLLGDENQRESQIELYKFQIDEIELADLKEGEEDQLTERRKVLQNTQKLTSLTSAVITAISGDTGDGALDLLARAADNTADISKLDIGQATAASEIGSIYSQLQDAARDWARYYATLEQDPSELASIEERLDAIYRLKRKYGGSVESALAHLADISAKLDFLINSEAELAKLKQAQALLSIEINRVCADISTIRQDAAKALQLQIAEILADLGMPSAQFAIDITRKDSFDADGFDWVEFLISANAGEAIAPLSKIASGGEMSRVMLALKAALSKYDSIETFIFDEIDAGVSGRTAQQVARKLSIIGRNHQILCITHLPQIAAMGDANFLIEKIPSGERMLTNVHHLNEQQIVSELARLIGGAEITQHTMHAAKDMREQATELRRGDY